VWGFQFIKGVNQGMEELIKFVKGGGISSRL
jgi:hypothetical protein